MMAEPDLEKKLRQEMIEASTRYFDAVFKERKTYVKGERIGYAGRVFDKEELNCLTEACLDFWLTEGRFAEQFSNELCRFLSVPYCSLVNSGSSANLVGFNALTVDNLGQRQPISKGDEVITVAAGFPTTIAPIIQFGATPVFADISLPTYNIDCSQLEAALSEKTRAVMLAHTLGNPFDIEQVLNFCRKNDLWLIEDNCDALGSRYLLNGEWAYTGSFGDIGTSSFYPPHHITTGEGGAVYTSDKRIHRNILSFRDWGRDCFCPPGQDNTCNKRFSRQYGELPQGYDHKYVYANFGYNLKMTDMQAAIGCAQMKKLDMFTRKRKENFKMLHEALLPFEESLILPEATPNSDPSWFGFPMTIRDNKQFTREAVVTFLESKGIQTRMLFGGNMVRQPCFDKLREKDEGWRRVGNLTTTDRVMEDTFWIGVYPGLSDDHIEYMIDTIITFITDKSS